MTMTESEEAERPARSYGLRARSLQKRQETERRCAEPRAPRQKQRSAPLSKYRRKTANHRERERMKDIAGAFDVLQSALPAPLLAHGEKPTKLTVLRMAVRYIQALGDALDQEEAPVSLSPPTSPSSSPAPIASAPSLGASPAGPPAPPQLSAAAVLPPSTSAMFRDATLDAADPLDSLDELTDFQLPDGFDALLSEPDEGISVTCSDFGDLPTP